MDQPKLSNLEEAIKGVFIHRNSWWLWLSIALMVGIWYLARHMVSVALFKLALITIATYVGYLASLAMEGALGIGKGRRQRPHELMADAAALRAASPSSARANDRAWELDQLAAAMLWRRAMIVCGAMIASALGG
jgi:hypothetical protein